MRKYWKLAVGMGIALMIGALACAAPPEPAVETLDMDTFLWTVANRGVAGDPSICERIPYFDSSEMHISEIQAAINMAYEGGLVDNPPTEGNVSQLVFYYEYVCDQAPS